MRIFTSRWVTRLWTMQEAGLAIKLLFRFSDGMVMFREIWGALQNRHEANLATAALHRDLVWSCINLRVWYRDDLWPIKAIDLSIPLREMQRRRASVWTDEALCIATLLRLDSETIARAVPTCRMEAVWKLMSRMPRGIPSTIIFNTLPRLTTPGFGWAPSTLMANDSRSDLSFGLPHSRKGTLKNAGLKVEYEGWKLREARPPWGISKDFIPGLVDQSRHAINAGHLIIVRDLSRKWYHVMPKTMSPKKLNRIREGTDSRSDDLLNSVQISRLVHDDSRDWRILLGENESAYTFGSQYWRPGLFAFVQRHDREAPTMKSTLAVSIVAVQAGWQEIWQIGHEYGTALRHTRLVRCMQILTFWQRFVSGIVLAVPGVVKHHKVTGIIQHFARTRKALGDSFFTCLEFVTRHAAANSLIMRAWQRTGKREDQIGELNGFMILSFMGAYVAVEEAYAATQEWYID